MPKVRYKIHYFKSVDCPRCKEAEGIIKALRDEKHPVLTHDIGEAGGLAEASFYGVLSTPTIILEHDEREVGRWHNAISADKIRAKIGKLGG